MNIQGLSIRNFVCYRGEHNLVLTPQPYAVVARDVNDPRRSNWLGKSTLLESVWFALYGEHRWPSEDSWITYGEQEGGVTLLLSNGFTIERSRIRGSATRLIVGNAKGAEAQALINDMVGLDRQDFEATCYWRQKRMNRFVVDRPADRMATVVGWLRLEKLDECIEHVSASLSRQAEAVEVYQTRLRMNRAAIDELVRANLPPETCPGFNAATASNRDIAVALNNALQGWTEAKEQVAGTLARLEDDNQRLVQWGRDEVAANAYARIVEQGKQLKASLDTLDVRAMNNATELANMAHRKALDIFNTARRDVQQKEQLKRGQFTGECPVAGMACPVKADINAATAHNAKLYAEAFTALQGAKAALDAASVAKAEAEARGASYTTAMMRLESYREEAKKHYAAANRFARGCPVANPGELQADIDRGRNAVANANARITNLRVAIARFDELLTDSASITKHIEYLKHEADTLRETSFVFKRSRQRIAEGALANIEVGANHLLVESGIDLSLTARWRREGEGLADACELCGAAFGASRKVKVCGRCGEARGPKMVNKLELVLSNTSGAAEDLAGGAFQLSASAWLRKRRACGWSTALIDEPFGALDEANRDAFAAHLGTILRGTYGFDQALIVSHSPGTMEALPGRIEVSSDGRFSTPRVI